MFPTVSMTHDSCILRIFLPPLQVLKWVEEAVQSSKVHLLSTDHSGGVRNTWQLPFDPSLKEVTVALSGPAPNIEIRNPQGMRGTATQTD